MKRLLIYILFVSFCLGQLGRFSPWGNEVVLHLNDFVVGIFVLLMGILNRKRFVQVLKTNSLARPVAVWVLVMVLSLLTNLGRLETVQILVSSLYLFRWITYAGLYFSLETLESEHKRLLRPWLGMATLFVMVTGGLQYVFLPNVAYLQAFDWDDHYFRLIGIFLDPAFTGAILSLGIALIYCYKFPVKLGRLKIAFLGLTYAALVLTYSRASYLMYLFSFSVIAWYRRSLKLILATALVFALTIAVLPSQKGEGTDLGRENSILSRILNWQRSVEVWKESPILGIGFNSYRYAAASSPKSHSGGADSSLLLVLATTGIVGFTAYLWVLGSMWRQGRRNLVFAASFLGVIAHSWFNNTLFYPWIMEWLWILLVKDERT